MRRRANRVVECIVQVYVDRLLHPGRDVNAGIWRRWYAGVGGLCDTVPQRFLALITEQVKSVVLDEMLF